MAVGPTLVDLALLQCTFAVVNVDADAAESTDDSDVEADAAASTEASPEIGAAEGDQTDPNGPAEGTLELDGVLLQYNVTQEGEFFVLILQSVLTDASLPYEMSIVTGSRFTLADPPVTPDWAAATLVFVTYPYVREIVSSVTGRSPYAAFRLPPLTTLPHPRVTGADQSSAPAEE